MVKTHMAACLVATALAATPALAQTSTSSGSTDRPLATGSGSTTSGSPAMNPATSGASSGSAGSAMGSSGSSTMGASSSGTAGSTTGSSSSSPGSATSGARGNFVERQQPGQFFASRLVGTTVYGSNNERIGDVNDVLMDREGRAQALVIGVGGFLGIGEKNVAVPFTSVEFSSGAMPSTSANTTSGNGPTGGAASGTSATTGGTAATTGSTGGVGVNSTMRNDGTPDRIILRMTRDQLNAAPQFTRLSSTVGDGSGAGSGSRANAPGSVTSSGTAVNPATGSGATR
jgi:sporulation protein YlmC with PRC-barrel domain